MKKILTQNKNLLILTQNKNLLMINIFINQPIIYLIFSAYAALIKSFEDFCLAGIEICNANLQ